MMWTMRIVRYLRHVRPVLFAGAGVCAAAAMVMATIVGAAAPESSVRAATASRLAPAPAPAPAPMRIVSTSPGITETLFALGLGSRVVGVSKYCRFPAEVAALPKVGTFLRPSPELIAQLRPDLVIVHAGPNGLESKLSGLGIRVVTVERGSLASVYSTIRALGEATQATAAAQALVSRVQGRLEAIRAEGARHPRRKVLMIVGRRAGMLSDLVAVGRDSYLNDVIAIAGGTNVLDDATLPAYPRISVETVIRLAPDVIVDTADMGDAVDDLARRRAATEALWRRQTMLAAARNGGVHAAGGDVFTVPGPRVVDAADTLAGYIRSVK